MSGWKPDARCPDCGRPPNVRFTEAEVRRAKVDSQSRRIMNVQCTRCRTRYWIRASEIARSSADANGRLPSSFPGYHALRSAGIETVSGLFDIEDYTTIKGVGAATDRAIRAALAEYGATV